MPLVSASHNCPPIYTCWSGDRSEKSTKVRAETIIYSCILHVANIANHTSKIY